ncbi:class I histocompatibility antigen, F10 alpha chain-like isoform X3 [Corvus hawaiiensis]|uniref:class I histocompatibility antigen, F10 alpha chain-like isoform X3 n=1 Tax=Corvus hawaiiensis TaxID=134902 RepID=UPI0020187184|nr:class I histocompatibility antigen, F10 alpha chain-like isoform X3 [Corvus hawaiiensis]
MDPRVPGLSPLWAEPSRFQAEFGRRAWEFSPARPGGPAGRGRGGSGEGIQLRSVTAAMAPALGLGVLLGLLGLLGTPGRATKVLHSLRYLHVAVSEPGPGVPQFVSVGFLDGIPFWRYDSERGRMEPQTPWMEEGPEPGYWDGQTEICKGNQHTDAIDLEMLHVRYNQSRGLHTLQYIYGCDLLSDGSVHGSFRYGYDGRDFLSFEPGSQSFVVADGTAQVTRRLRNSDGFTVERQKNYPKHICPEELRKYVRYGKQALEHKEPPDVHVSEKEEFGTLILSCHAYGFYPRPIAVSWMKGDEIRDQETVVPNSDGTFHTWARIEARPEEREQYRCRVEHSRMLEPGIFAWEPESGRNLTLVVTVFVITAIVILVLLVGFIVWKLQSGRWQNHGYSPPAGKDVETNGSTAVQITA